MPPDGLSGAYVAVVTLALELRDHNQSIRWQACRPVRRNSIAGDTARCRCRQPHRTCHLEPLGLAAQTVRYAKGVLKCSSRSAPL